jgi:hypothetical protein
MEDANKPKPTFGPWRFERGNFYRDGTEEYNIWSDFPVHKKIVTLTLDPSDEDAYQEMIGNLFLIQGVWYLAEIARKFLRVCPKDDPSEPEDKVIFDGPEPITVGQIRKWRDTYLGVTHDAL